MKKIYTTLQLLVFVAMLNVSGLFAQCLGGNNYANVTSNGPFTNDQMAYCMWPSERNTMNINYISGAYSFTAVGASYITIYDASNNVIAQGATPLNGVVFLQTGTYYFRPTSVGPPACTPVPGGNGTCIDVFWTCDPPPCVGVPSTGTVSPNPVIVCPGESSQIDIPGVTIGTGLQYQWYSAPNIVGPYTAITGATGDQYFTPTSQVSTVFYQVVVTCTWSSQSATSTAVPVDVAGLTTSSVPYFESFEGITYDGMMPNCSWLFGNPGVTESFIMPYWGDRYARTGSRYASFHTSYASGPNFYYSNGIQMEPGITYSATVWYKTDQNTWNLNINDVSLSVGPNQSPTGLVLIDSDLNPMGVTSYKPLTGLFTVPTSGLYYMAVGMDGMGSYGTEWLTWDDLEVTIPCSLNAPNMTVGSNVPVICTGQQLTLNAGGADTYEWYNGSTSPSIVEVPASAGYMSYTVVGTNAISGCSVTAAIPVVVNASPLVFGYATNPLICLGTQINLIANGTAQSYTWNGPGVSNSNAMVISVNPTTTGASIYNISGMDNTNGCVTMASVQVSVNALPTVIATSDAPGNTICRGESLNLSGAGGVSYQWSSNMSTILTSIANVQPQATTTYTLMGTNSNGCVGKATIEVTVNECTGINQVSTTLSGVKVYPNPTAGIFTIELNNNTSKKNVQVTDLSGRVIMTNTSNNETMNVNIENLANGIYYVKIQSDNAVDVIKIIKD